MPDFSNLVSVIVCTYNQQDTIGRTLDSILGQKCHLPVEIVVGEDCSTDRTLDVCRRYEAQHPGLIRILSSNSNKGLVRNYFDCIRACRGKYIADCAGDDFWIDDNKLEREVQILENNAKVGIVHTDWLRYDAQTGKMTAPAAKRSAAGIVSGHTLLADILMPEQRPLIHLCTALYRNEWVRQAMKDHPEYFDADRYDCEDMQIAFFLAQMGDVAYLDIPTLAYCWGKASVSNPKSERQQFRFWANVTQLAFRLAATSGIADPRFDRFLQKRVLKLFHHAFLAGEPTLRSEATRLQQRMHVKSNTSIRIRKALTLPGIWPAALHLRKFVKRHRASISTLI